MGQAPDAGHAPEHMSERMPQQLSDRMQNEMPELSEYMPASQIEC